MAKIDSSANSRRNTIRHQVQSPQRHPPRCVAVDVGMNDGFYTQMFGIFGCKVYSFELQPKCIEYSRLALEKNNITDRVTIFHAPVSSVHNSRIDIKFPEQNYCDGGFTFTGDHVEKGSHIKGVKFNRTKTFHAVSLDGMFLDLSFIDVLKIDVEGHDPQVIAGALKLFEAHRIGVAVVEISSWIWKGSNMNSKGISDEVESQFRIYEKLYSYNYTATLVTCRGVGSHLAGKHLPTFQDFKQMASTNRFCLDYKFSVKRS